LLHEIVKADRLLNDADAAAILRPSGFVVAHDGRTRLAVGDGLETAGIDTLRDEVVLHRGGATVTEAEVVLDGAALVAMTFDGHLVIRILGQERNPLVEGALGVGAEVRLVEREEDTVADIGDEVSLRTGRHARSGVLLLGAGVVVTGSGAVVRRLGRGFAG